MEILSRGGKSEFAVLLQVFKFFHHDAYVSSYGRSSAEVITR